MHKTCNLSIRVVNITKKKNLPNKSVGAKWSGSKQHEVVVNKPLGV